jgi:hypothetical protein
MENRQALEVKHVAAMNEVGHALAKILLKRFEDSFGSPDYTIEKVEVSNDWTGTCWTATYRFPDQSSLVAIYRQPKAANDEL